MDLPASSALPANQLLQVQKGWGGQDGDPIYASGTVKDENGSREKVRQNLQGCGKYKMLYTHWRDTGAAKQ